MQKVFKSILSFCLTVALCLGITAVANTAVTEYIVADASANYYAGITAKSGTALLGQLHDLIVSTHTTYTSYDDCKKYGPTTDPGLDGKGVMEFYTHETIMNFVGGVGDWNREHVWCQSLSNGLWDTGGGGSDMHHIRPSESGLNSTRGNNKYGYATGGKEAWSRDNNKNNSQLGGWYISNSIFEPLDNVKGDAARIVMYVYTHYNNASNVGGTKESAKTHGNLNFTNVIYASNETAAIQLLLEWNRLDPVDEIETYRNEAVYKIQGNRNPFIDDSSYAEAIWGNGNVTDPDGTLKSISLSETKLDLSVGGTRTLTVTPNPSTASASVTWSSSNTSVATVSNGKVIAVAEGTAVITATSSVNTSLKATATVTVKKSSSSETATGKLTITRDSFVNPTAGYAVQNWSANGVDGIAYMYGGKKDAIQFNTSKSSQYLASSTPTNGAIKKVTIETSGNSSWTLLTSTHPYSGITSGNPSNGTVQTENSSSSGTWTVSGNDTYFALVLGGSGAGYINSIEVEYGTGGSIVTPPNPPELESIFITPSSVTLEEGGNAKLTVESVPSTITAEVNWISSNTAVATVSSDGMVTAVKAGTATITATDRTNPEIFSTAIVNVTAKQVPVKTLEILPNPVIIKEGHSFNVSVEGYLDSEITWSTSDETVAVIDKYNNIVGCTVGQCVITATLTSDPTVKGTASVTVISEDDVQVSISHTTEIQLQLGDTEQLQAIFFPTDKSVSVSWSSSDESVVTVDSNGLLTAVGSGTAIITLTNNVNTNISDSQTVVVRGASSDSGNVQKFTDAFAKIAEAQTMSDMYNSIVNAVRAYNSLSADEKEIVAQQKEALEVVIEVYNALVDAANSAAAEAEANALGGLKG